MLGSKYDITMQQGSDFELLLTIKNETGNVRNLTDCSARMQIRPSYSSSTVAVNLTEDNGEIVMGGANGTIAISVSANTTANIKVDLTGKNKPPYSYYVYDLELIDSNQRVSKVLYGDVTVYGEVTR